MEATMANEIGELRQAVAQLLDWLLDGTDDPLMRASTFRRRRLDALMRGETPVALRGGPLLVLHVLPHAALARSAAFVGIEKAEFLIFGSGGSPAYNADGKLMWPEDPRVPEQRGYAQLGRTGWIEAARALREPEAEGQRYLLVREIERLLLEGTHNYLAALANLQMTGPLQVAATLLRVRGFILTSESYYGLSPLPIATDEVSLPAIHLAAPTLSEGQLPVALRSTLDVLWQTRGWPRCPHFAENGESRVR